MRPPCPNLSRRAVVEGVEDAAEVGGGFKAKLAADILDGEGEGGGEKTLGVADGHLIFVGNGGHAHGLLEAGVEVGGAHVAQARQLVYGQGAVEIFVDVFHGGANLRMRRGDGPGS